VSASVYEMYDADGVLLYIGRSVQVPARLQTHSQQKPWWTDVARIETTHLYTPEAAVRCESALIELKRPRWNVVGVPTEPEHVCTCEHPHPTEMELTICRGCGEVAVHPKGVDPWANGHQIT
jgi:excinuclease UvrABC nuclease subunit